MAHRSGSDQHIVTFKADDSLIDAMQGIANRSAFIRSAILAAIDSSCPLCLGAGVLNPNQKRHWLEFTKHHEIVTCQDCDEQQLICAAATQDSV